MGNWSEGVNRGAERKVHCDGGLSHSVGVAWSGSPSSHARTYSWHPGGVVGGPYCLGLNVLAVSQASTLPAVLSL